MICIFDDDLVLRANFRNRTHVQCPLPSLKHTSADLRICYEQLGCSTNRLNFSVVPSPILEHVEPVLFDVAGGTTVRFFGRVSVEEVVSPVIPFLFAQHFVSAKSSQNFALCLFGNIGVKPVEHSEEKITCISPGHAAEFVDVSLRFEAATGSHIEISGSSIASFRFISKPHVSHIVPSELSLESKQIVIGGGNFVSDIPFFCNFGLTRMTLAQVISSTRLSCPVPPDLVPGNISVRVTPSTTKDLAGKAGYIVFRDSTAIASISPTHGVVSGDGEISFFGTNYYGIHAPLCRFGLSSIVSGQLISSNEVRCISPPSSVKGRVNVSVSLNGGSEYVTAPETFTYTDDVTLSYIRLAPNMSDGTLLVYGSGFLPRKAFPSHCIINEAHMPAQIVSENELLCTPQIDMSNEIEMALSHGGRELSNTSIRLTRKSQAVATHFTVSSTVASHSEVLVRGVNFEHSEPLRCMYVNGISSVAKWISSSKISCPFDFSMFLSAPSSTFSIHNEFGAIEALFTSFDAPLMPQVSSLNLRVYPGSGRSLIDIRGTNLREEGSTFCVYDNALEVRASVTSLNLAHCQVPLIQSNFDAVRIVFHGVVVFEEDGEYLRTGRSSFNNLQFASGQHIQNRSILTLTGVSHNGREMSCFIGKNMTAVPSTFCNSSLKCTIDSRSGDKEVMLYIGENDSTPVMQFPLSLQLPVVVTSVFPTEVESARQTRLSIAGANFPRSLKTFCRFDDILFAPAEWISPRKLVCLTPSLAHGKSTVEIICEAYESQSFTLRVRSRIALGRIFPDTISSGTEIVVAGKGFDGTRNPTCRFGREIVPAAYFAMGQIRCVPLTISKRVTTLNLSISVNGDIYSGSAPIFRLATPSWQDLIVDTRINHENVVYHLNSALLSEGTDIVCHAAGLSKMAVRVSSPTSNLQISCSVPLQALTDTSQLICLEINQTRALQWCGSTILTSEFSTAYAVTADPKRVPAFPTTITDIAVTGGRFVRSSKLCCIVGGLRVFAKWISPRVVVCSVGGQIGNSQLVVHNDCESVASKGRDGLPIEFVAPASVEEVVPNTSLFQSNMILSLRGRNFISLPVPISCEFDGNSITTANVVDDNEIVCVTPLRAQNSTRRSVEVNLLSRGVPFPLEHKTSVQMKQAAIPRVLHVSPKWVPIGFQGNLAVTGEGFVSGLRCLFGLKWVFAHVLNYTDLYCSVPPVYEIGSTTVRISFSQMEEDIQESNFVVHFYQAPIILGLYPSVALAGRETPLVVDVSSGRNNRLPLETKCFFRIAKHSPPLYTVATATSSKRYLCLTPNASPGSYEFGISFDAYDSVLDRSPFFLELISQAVLQSVWPKNGPVDGGTEVKVFGTNLHSSTSEWKCRFGDILVPSTCVSDTEIRCVSPPNSNVQKKVLVSLVLDDDDVVDDGQSSQSWFTYANNLLLHKLMPDSGPSNGGTNVTLEFTADPEALDTLALACSFGNVGEIPARVLTWGKAVCTSPRRQVSGPEIVRLSMNSGLDYSNILPFDYLETASVRSIYPTRGPYMGGTTVTVFGSNFDKTVGLACVFGDGASVESKFVSSEQVICVTPAVVVPSTLPLVVTTNRDDTSTQAYFEFFGLGEIRSASVLIGPPIGGTRVVITGGQFMQPSNQLACQFGEKVVRGMWLRENAMVCVTPPMLEGDYALKVSVNFWDSGSRGDFGSDGLFFSYRRTPRVLSVTPSNGYATTKRRPKVITIGGENFINSTHLGCAFVGGEFIREKEVYGSATFVSPTEVLCHPPQTLSASRFVQVSLDGQHFSRDRQRYDVYHTPYVQSVSPLIGPELGGTQVFIHGVNLAVVTQNGSCLFGNISSSIVAKSSTVVSCMSPTGRPMGQALHLVHDTLDEFHVENFVHQQAATISFISPEAGSESGGDIIHVYGHGFVTLTPVSCRFDQVSVAAEVVDDKELSCITPPHVQGTARFALISSTQVTPSPTIFTFTAIIHIEDFRPAAGPVEGGTHIVVKGRQFTKNASFYCRFGDNLHMMAAIVTSSTELACVSPPHVGNASKVEFVVVTKNGTSTSDTHYFVYQAKIVLSTVIEGISVGPDRNFVVSGQNFVDSTDLSCMLGHIIIQCRWQSSSMLIAFIPSRQAFEASSILSVSNNGVDFVSTSSAVIIHANDSEEPTAQYLLPSRDVSPQVDPSSLLAFEPVQGPAIGGTLLKVYIVELAIRDVYSCQFGTQFVDATRESSEIAICKTPVAQHAGKVKFAFWVGNKQLVSTDMSFEYYSDTHVHRLEPSNGIHRGGTPVSVYATNLKPSGSLRCQFGGRIVVGTYISGDVLECVSPEPATASWTYSVDVSISIDGKTFGSTSAQYTYMETPRLIQVYPNVGWSIGGDLIVASLSTIPTLVNNCACYFGQERSNGTLSHSGDLRCRVPRRRSTSLMFDNTVMMGVSCDVDGSSIEVQPRLHFTYVEPIEVLFVEPSVGTEVGGTLVNVVGQVSIHMFRISPLTTSFTEFSKSRLIALSIRRRWCSSDLDIEVTNNLCFESPQAWTNCCSTAVSRPCFSTI